MSPAQLDGKVAVITGASRGIGASAAGLFAAAGATVVLAARDREALEGVARNILDAGGEALVVPTDITKPSEVEQLVEQAVKTYGRLDVAFNNAGAGHRMVALAELQLAEYESALAVNLTGLFLSMKYEIPAMLATGGGAIVNMSSTAGLAAKGGLAAYVAANHGAIGLTTAAAVDYAALGVRVNAVAPGPIITDRLAAAPQVARDHVASAVPLQRIGSPAEVAGTAAWLCSEAAAYLTGAVLPVDGGRLAGSA